MQITDVDREYSSYMIWHRFIKDLTIKNSEFTLQMRFLWIKENFIKLLVGKRFSKKLQWKPTKLTESFIIFYFLFVFYFIFRIFSSFLFLFTSLVSLLFPIILLLLPFYHCFFSFFLLFPFSLLFLSFFFPRDRSRGFPPPLQSQCVIGMDHWK